MLTDEQLKEVAVRWCESQGIDPDEMSNVPRLGASFGYQAYFKPIWEAVADEMRRIEKEDSMRKSLTDYKNDVLSPPTVFGYQAGHSNTAKNCCGIGHSVPYTLNPIPIDKAVKSFFAGEQSGKVRNPSTALGSNSGGVDPNPNMGLDSSAGLSAEGCCVGFVVRDPASGSHSVCVDNKKKSD
jgi:hypothetical protein